jgi:carboxyl-terminal processing protease
MLRCAFSLFFLVPGLGTFGQTSVSVQQEAIQLKKKLLEYHVSPRRIDDRFSADVYNRFINSLDPDKLYFSQQDLDDLKAFETTLDDELEGISWNFLEHAKSKFKENLERSEKIVIKHTAEPFDFGKDEIYRSDTIPALGASENESRWRTHLKFETLNELIRLRASMATIPDKEFLEKKEGEARQQARKTSLRMINRILHHPTGYENYVESLFLR